MNRTIKILFLADTHLGFDLPARPRVERRRRGVDFARNFEAALEPALNGEVDLVVHGGDVLYRSKVPPSQVIDAFTPLFRVADAGVPVFVVPGNHERSAIPYPLLAMHKGVHIFHQPQTFTIEVKGRRISLSGFPYHRDAVRANFRKVLKETGFEKKSADIQLLCMHHAVEGATVGPVNYMFTTASDVVRVKEIPRCFAAVLSGHIHRAQIVDKDLNGNPIGVPVIYPGSTERTSFAEKDEAKGFYMLELEPDGTEGIVAVDASFNELATRPMVEIPLCMDGKSLGQLETEIKKIFSSMQPDSIVRFKVETSKVGGEKPTISTAFLRSLSRSTMNVELSYRVSGES